MEIDLSDTAEKGAGDGAVPNDSGGATGCAGGWAWFVALVALAVRLVYDAETAGVPFLRHLIGDAAGYYDWAASIARGDWLGRESFYQAPLYPYVLGAWAILAGPGVRGIRLLQALWGAAGAGCLAYGTGRLFGRRAGIVAGLMWAFYAPAVFFDGIIQKASLDGLLTCALLASMTWVEGHGRRRGVSAITVSAIGVLGGLLVLTRENALVWLVIVGIWVWWLGGRAGWRWRSSRREYPADGTGGQAARGIRNAAAWFTLGAYVIGVALVLVPVGVRNKIVGGEWSVSTFQAGPNFYIGNHRGADGRYQPLVRGHESPAFERKDATVLAERASGRPLSPREVSRYWVARAMADIREDPWWWLGLTARKMLMVWNRYEVPDVESPAVYREDSLVLRVLTPVWHFGVLCPLAAVGVASTWSHRRRLWVYYGLIVSMALAVALFYVMARYRFVLVPLLISFAVAGVVSVWSQLAARRGRPLWTWGTIAAAVAVVVNWPVHDERRLDAMAWMNAGVALAQKDDVAGATDCFRRAVAGHPQSAEANNNLAQALALQGDYASAVRHYQAALAAEPTLMGAAYNLAVALEHLGRLDEALRYYERAVEVDAADADASRAIDRLHKRVGP